MNFTQQLLLINCALITMGVSGEAMPSINPFKKPDMLITSPIQTTQKAAVVNNSVLPLVRATMAGGASPMALVEDKILSVGELSNSYKLIEVQEGVAIFSLHGKRIEVPVQTSEKLSSEKNENSNEN